MNDRPTPLELIRIANETLARDILPDAKAEQLYPLRMIANALNIAARELAAHDRNGLDETQGLNALYGETGEAKMPGELRARNRQFAQDIRQGAFENSAAQAIALRQHLTATARAKLAAAYPKGLTS
jgi:Domain of unknown function (DUF6285)